MSTTATQQELLSRVLQSPRLPSLPTIALEVIALSQQPDAEFSRVAEVIQTDPALSSRILETANSAFYGQMRSIVTINRALQVLGLNTVKTLALGFSLVDNLQRSCDKGFDYVTYWRRSLYTGTAAKTLSRQLGLAQSEEAFLGGLLQDIGMIAMSQALGEDYLSVLRSAGSDHAALRACEVAALGADHAEIGAALAETWGLPPLLVAPIRCHEEPDRAEEGLQAIVRTVAIGNDAAEVFLSEQEKGTALDTYYARAKVWFEIEREAAAALLKEIHGVTKGLGRLFNLPTGDLGDSDEILARATDALIELTLTSQRENDQLRVAVGIDALTGVPNRRAFDQCINDQFRSAAPQRPVSLIFVDIDRFKRFNDTYGHAVGDRVLTDVAKTLQTAVSAGGTLFRCGGEEFAVVCPRLDGGAARALAEAVRAQVEKNARVTSDDGEELSVTCSLGVATHTGGVFEDLSQFLKAADESLYDAKEAGRNCVRTHCP